MAPSVDHYAPVDAALAQVLDKIRVDRRAEFVPSTAAFGRVSAEDVLATYGVPRSSTSHWDGYAVMSGDVAAASGSTPVSLKVVGFAGPSARSKFAITRGETVQVATGASMPMGSDAVVPVESAEREGDHIVLRRPEEAGSHVYAAGGDVRKGDAVLRKGQAVRTQDIGLLLALGFRRVRVWERPRVSVIATGSELTGAHRPSAGKVVNSHSPVFLKLCESLGCVPVDLGIARDDMTVITRRLRRALSKSDFVLTLGGTSVGEHDYIMEAINGFGPDALAHGVKMDRGRVTGVAVVGGKPVLMMPGPIQGAMNAFLLLGLPIIEVLSGAKRRDPELECVLGEAWEARARYADFCKVVYVKLAGGRGNVAEPLGAETESMKILADADGYIVVPENVTRIDAGGRVIVKLLLGFSYV